MSDQTNLLHQTDAYFYTTAAASIALSIGSAILVWRAMRTLGGFRSTATRSEVGNITFFMMFYNLVMAVIVGIIGEVIVISIKQTSQSTRAAFCWPVGIAAYFFFVNGHCWALCLALRIAAVLSSRLSPSTSCLRSVGIVLVRRLNWMTILCFCTCVNLITAVMALARTLHNRPHRFVLTGGGCWVGEANGLETTLMVAMSFFLLAECVLFWWAHRIVHRKKHKVPELVETTFWSVLLFTGSLLCVDIVLCAAVLAVHSYRLGTGSSGDTVLDSLVLYESLVLYAYPGAIAALFYFTATDDNGVAIITNRRVDASFIVYAESESDGEGGVWRQAQKQLLTDRHRELMQTVGAPVQAWKEENADDLPFRFVTRSIDTLIEAYQSDCEDLTVFVQDAVAFDEAMWRLYDEFTEEQIASRPRKVTGYTAPTESDVNDEESNLEETGDSVSATLDLASHLL